MKTNKIIKLLIGLSLLFFIIGTGSVFAYNREEDDSPDITLVGPVLTIDYQLTENKGNLFGSDTCWRAPAFGGYEMNTHFDIYIPGMEGRYITWQLDHPGIDVIVPDDGAKLVGSNGWVSFDVTSPIFESKESSNSKNWTLKIGGNLNYQIPNGTVCKVIHSTDGYFKPEISTQTATVGNTIKFEDKDTGTAYNPGPEKPEFIKIPLKFKTRLVDRNLKNVSGSVTATYTISQINYGSASKGIMTINPSTITATYNGNEVLSEGTIKLTNYSTGTFGVCIQLNKGISGINYSGKSYRINYNFDVNEKGKVTSESYINSDFSTGDDGVFYLIKQEDKPVQPTPTPQPEPTPTPSNPGADGPSIDPPTVPVSGVSVKPGSLSLNVGNGSTLTASVSPNTATNKKVRWSSGNSYIATVDANGYVKAVAAGTTAITATSEDGNKTAFCTVTVNSPVVHKDPEKVTLSASSITMDIGGSYNLVGTVQPADAQNKTLTWTTSDGSVATVSDGNVIAKGAGSANITVKTSNNKTASCKVTVNKPAEVVKNVTNITLDKTNNLLNVGDSFVLHQTIKPEDATNKNVTWTSSNSNVVVTGDGKVVAEKAGTATITVTTADGNKKATCTVTVKAPENKHIAVTAITLDQSSKTIKNGESLTLNETVVPKDATNKNITWFSSNDKVAQVNEYGIVKAINPGTAEIIVTTEDGNKTAKCVVTVEKDEEVVVKPTEDFKPEENVEPTPTPTPTPDPTPEPEPQPQPEPSQPSVQPTPQPQPEQTKSVSVSYETHVENIGWGNIGRDGGDSGTTGQSLRLEGIKINLSGNANLGISYSTHVQDIGWMNFVENGNLSGTTGQSKRLEAIKIQLTGSDKDKYDVYYRVHAQDVGWMNWAKNGASAGTAGFARRLEAIEIQVVPKGQVPAIPTSTPNATESAFLQK